MFLVLVHNSFIHLHLAIFIAGDQLERLLVLESEFGTLPGFTPALDAVIDFLTTVRSAVSACPPKWQNCG